MDQFESLVDSSESCGRQVSASPPYSKISTDSAATPSPLEHTVSLPEVSISSDEVLELTDACISDPGFESDSDKEDSHPVANSVTGVLSTNTVPVPGVSSSFMKAKVPLIEATIAKVKVDVNMFRSSGARDRSGKSVYLLLLHCF